MHASIITFIKESAGNRRSTIDGKRKQQYNMTITCGDKHYVALEKDMIEKTQELFILRSSLN